MHISFFFSVGNCYLLTWKMAHILSNSKTFKFSPGNSYLFLLFCQTANFSCISFFFCFSVFCEFQYHFYKNIFGLTFIMGISYFILVWRELTFIQRKKLFFPFYLKFAIQSYPFMQLHLIFHKTLKKASWKPDNFKVKDWVAFQQLRKL